MPRACRNWREKCAVSEKPQSSAIWLSGRSVLTSNWQARPMRNCWTYWLIDMRVLRLNTRCNWLSLHPVAVAH